MPIVNCKICHSPFYAKPSWLRRGVGKYCEAKCAHTAQRNGKKVKCFICRKETYKTNKALTHSKSGNYFCGKSCQTIWRNSEFTGPKHANYIDGRFSYRTVLTRNKIPKVCSLCKTVDKRILAVHHIDENHQNNDLKNLAWLCHNCHFLVHHDKLEKQKFMATMV